MMSVTLSFFVPISLALCADSMITCRWWRRYNRKPFGNLFQLPALFWIKTDKKFD
jgi:hypothetical protein